MCDRLKNRELKDTELEDTELNVVNIEGGNER